MFTVKNQFWINLNSIERAKDFADLIASVPCDVDACSGRYVVDGKSLLGLFSLDLSKPVRVVVQGTDEDVEKVVRLSKHLWVEGEEE